jgi:hypothetical protein
MYAGAVKQMVLFSSSDPALSWGIVCHKAENVHWCSPDAYIFTVSFLFY